MNEAVYNYKKGLPAMGLCYLMWGFQPLYYQLDTTVDTNFLLACRVIWAAVCCLAILACQGKLPQLWAVFRDKKVLLREIPAALLLFADWAVYLIGVRAGRVQECSMGYYIMPLVMFALGALLFREKFGWTQLEALVFIVAGIALSAGSFGRFPYITVTLALCFAVYSALKKSLEVDSIVSTSAEILLMVPLALLYILFFARGEITSDLTLGRQLFLMGSGLVTGLPMVFFSAGVVYLPLTVTAISQYLSPSLSLMCSLLLGESFSREKLISFAFIWTGVIIYAGNEVRQARKAMHKTE